MVLLFNFLQSLVKLGQDVKLPFIEAGDEILLSIVEEHFHRQLLAFLSEFVVLRLYANYRGDLKLERRNILLVNEILFLHAGFSPRIFEPLLL